MSDANPQAIGLKGVGAPSGGFDAADIGRRSKAVLIGSAGNLIEWYDIYAYSAFSLYFAGAFFPQTDPVAQQLAAASLFAAAFFVRPLGGALFGYFADRRGRRNALTGSVLLMCFGSLLIAATPTYATIGFAAPVVLAIARLLQSLSQGGEYGSGATYLSEVAHPNRRGFYSGVWYMTLIGGQLCAILVLLVLQKIFLTPEQLKAWGWRIPFVIGALLSILAYILRRDMPETELFTAAKPVIERENAWRILARNWKAMALVVGITIGGTSAFYTYTTYMQKFLKLSVGLNDCADDSGHGRLASVRADPAAALWRRIRQGGPQADADRLRRPWNARDGSAADDAAAYEKPVRRLSSDLRRLGHRQRLHLDRGHRQSRIVSDRDPGHGRRRALRADGGNFRRVGRLGRAQLQKRQFRGGVLLVCDGLHFHLAYLLHFHARYENAFENGAGFMTAPL